MTTKPRPRRRVARVAMFRTSKKKGMFTRARGYLLLKRSGD
jgi:hypothetical protein